MRTTTFILLRISIAQKVTPQYSMADTGLAFGWKIEWDLHSNTDTCVAEG